MADLHRAIYNRRMLRGEAFQSVSRTDRELEKLDGNVINQSLGELYKILSRIDPIK